MSTDFKCIVPAWPGVEVDANLSIVALGEEARYASVETGAFDESWRLPLVAH